MDPNENDEIYRRRLPRFSGVKSLAIFFEERPISLLDISEKGMRIAYDEEDQFAVDGLTKFKIVLNEKGKITGHELFVRCTWVNHPEYGFVFGSNTIGRNIWRSIYSDQSSNKINIINGTEY